MTWDYSGDPASSDKDEVRFRVGDTDTTDQLVTDEEINWSLAEYPDTILASAIICRAIAAKFSRLADKTVGDISESASQKAETYLSLADELDAQASTLALPSFGGESISEKEALDADADAVQPSFRIGQDDNPEIPSEREYSPYDRYRY